MNIATALRSITEYTLTLSEADVLEAVTSPYIFADKLADQLRAAGVLPTAESTRPRRKTKRGKSAGWKALRDDHFKKKAGRPNGNGKRGRPPAAAKANLCPEPGCGRSFTYPGFLKLHLEKEHPGRVLAAES